MPSAERGAPQQAQTKETLELGPCWRREKGRERLVFRVHGRLEKEVASFPRVEVFRPGRTQLLTSVKLERVPSPTPFEIWQAEWEPVSEEVEYLLRWHPDFPPLLDPYAPALSGGERWGCSEDRYGPGVGRQYRCFLKREWFFAEATGTKWRIRPNPRFRVICELHVRGFTIHPSSGVTHRGTFLGLVEKIPYLLDLGVTSVELLPVSEFDETDNPRKNPRTGERLWNFWGYAPVSFFAPKAAYAAQPARGGAVSEFRLLVEELHRAGLEVILDVVYNHTGEHADYPVSWMGLDREAYYLLGGSEPALLDFTGCGHTFQVAHEVSKKMILDSLRHWVRWYDVDGFRLDLAGAFFRGSSGERVERSALVEAIGADPILEDRLWIAEPWDATGYLPEKGFPPPWRLWHGEFRDDVRRLVRGDAISPERLAKRFGGGRTIGSRQAERFVDFVACHDGFPVADLVQYAHKHNEENGEENRDGSDWDFSANYGQEGPTTDPEIEKIRSLQRRNLLALWALASTHTLLFPAGDEGGRTQGGNNNPWCQDNERSWMVWGDLDPLKIRWFRELLRLRRRLLRTPRALVTPVTGFRVDEARRADADQEAAGAAGFLWRDRKGQKRVFWAWNFSEQTCSFVLPDLEADRHWVLRLDTSLPEPPGIHLMRRGVAIVDGPKVALPARCVRLWRSQPVRWLGARLRES